MSRANAEGLRRMAQWYRDRRGFSPHLYAREGKRQCGCFCRARNERSIEVCLFATHLPDLVGGRFDVDGLIAAGWTGPECTDDAIAVLEMAADIESCEP